MKNGLVVVLLALASPCLAQSGTITYQGSLCHPDGRPISESSCRMYFALYDAVAAGRQLWTETETSVTIRQGLFSVILGDGAPFGTLFSTAGPVWLEVAADLDQDGTFETGEVYAPRQPFAGVPWAREAARLQGLEAAAFQRRITGTAPAGRFIRTINANGSIFTGGDAARPVEYAVHAADATTVLVALSASGLRGRPVTTTAPLVGQMLRWNGSAWGPVAPDNQPPVALLDVKPEMIYLSSTSETVQLDLRASYDPEGTPLTYAFDFMLAGSTPTEWSTIPITAVFIREPGDMLVGGWVRDAAGAVARSQTMLYVYRWIAATPAMSANVGQHASQALVGFQPAVAFYGVSNGNLNYVRAIAAGQGLWSAPVTVDSVGDVGQYASLEFVDGQPAIVGPPRDR